MSYTNREVVLFQLWAKRAEVEWIISLHKKRLSEIHQQVKKIARLVNIEKKEREAQKADLFPRFKHLLQSIAALEARICALEERIK